MTYAHTNSRIQESAGCASGTRLGLGIPQGAPKGTRRGRWCSTPGAQPEHSGRALARAMRRLGLPVFVHPEPRTWTQAQAPYTLESCQGVAQRGGLVMSESPCTLRLPSTTAASGCRGAAGLPRMCPSCHAGSAVDLRTTRYKLCSASQMSSRSAVKSPVGRAPLTSGGATRLPQSLGARTRACIAAQMFS